MSVLPQYRRSERGRFDFRLPDGLGAFVWPDWDDPELQVEFYDADNECRVTARVNGAPALVRGDDYDTELNPEGGPFVSVEGIDLRDFALGVAEAYVYARLEGVKVFPWPTIIAAFEVTADLGEGPLYSLVERVRAEIPGTWPAVLTEEMILLAIADASRKIDAFLRLCYSTPFPDITTQPCTPALIELICRKLAAYQCLEWMGRVNAPAEESLKERALSLLLRLVPAEGKTPLVRLPGYEGPLAAYWGRLKAEEGEEDVLA